MEKENKKKYWRKNLKYLFWLLSVWLLVSIGAGILFADFLNNYFIGGYPLGFWFAQQGAIFIFVILIFIYVFLMNRLDKRFNVDEK